MCSVIWLLKLEEPQDWTVLRWPVRSKTFNKLLNETPQCYHVLTLFYKNLCIINSFTLFISVSSTVIFPHLKKVHYLSKRQISPQSKVVLTFSSLKNNNNNNDNKKPQINMLFPNSTPGLHPVGGRIQIERSDWTEQPALFWISVCFSTGLPLPFGIMWPITSQDWGQCWIRMGRLKVRNGVRENGEMGKLLEKHKQGKIEGWKIARVSDV